jgi:hypothetical protein
MTESLPLLPSLIPAGPPSAIGRNSHGIVTAQAARGKGYTDTNFPQLLGKMLPQILIGGNASNHEDPVQT